MFERGDRVLVACSGGPDSVCLLDALVRLRRLLGIRVDVFHFDHRLRSGSGSDATYVRRLSARLELPFHLRAARDGPAPGASVEQWARTARREAATEILSEIGADRVALGHTLDDQAETVLLALVLGWGPEGLAGMRPVSGAEVRPLFDVRREQTHAYCRSIRLRPRQDPTNRDQRYLRNAIRLQAIPALELATGREVHASIARTSELLRADHGFLWDEAVRIAERLVEPTELGFRIRVRALLELPRPISSRVLRRGLQTIGASWTQADIDAALDLAAGRPGRRRDLTGRLLARRDRVYLSLSRTSPESRV